MATPSSWVPCTRDRPRRIPKMPYNSTRDLVAVAHIGTVPNLVVVNEQIPARTLAELVSWIKANPGKANYATGGAGHHAAFQHRDVQGTVRHLPGADSLPRQRPAVTDLIANNVQVMFETLPSAAVQVRAGKLKALAVTSARRTPLFPTVPTLAESGYPGLRDEHLVRRDGAGQHFRHKSRVQ